MRYLIFLVGFLINLCSMNTAMIARESFSSIQEKTQGMEKYPGFFNYYWDSREGKLWLEITDFDREFLYLTSLSAGVGSNDIGLDRSQVGRSRIVKFHRVGPKILLIQPNYTYRAISENPAERRSVEEAFAQSVLWDFKVEAEEAGRVLVDATQFFLRDAHDVIGRLKDTRQGNYKLDTGRSAIYLPRTKNFPKNTEVEALLTFTGEPEGNFVRQVVPSPEAITVREHHSLVKLPDPGYEPRKYDPRAGFWGIEYMDFATPVGEPIVKRFIARHRLRKKDPTASMSEPVEPIVYYVDSGAPEPIRSALVEGASWWNQAFEAAGYKNAFQVKILPEDADPMDVRYNVITWVHRSTRGWSYGRGVVDPRTGEIIKGHVNLGSLRVRQDYLIAEGLLAPYEEGKPVSPEMLKMALARLRQLAAHEVGHTLGLRHNFAASVFNRASVMDYPHPLIRINEDGTLDLSQAYETGIGEWDKVAIAYGYQDFPDGNDHDKALEDILHKAFKRGLIFISDQDARPAGGAHPLAHLWDNGTNAVDELQHILAVRKIALQRFGENNIRPGQPLATLEEVLVPVYLMHRYQTEAAAKVLGGLFYTYAVRGDGQKITEIVDADEQRRALQVLLKTLSPATLALPEKILQLIPPRPPGYPRSRETFNSRTGVTFDPLAAVESAANHTLQLLLHPQRATRLVEFHARNPGYPGLSEVLDRIIEATWKQRPPSPYHAEIQRVVNNLVLYHLMNLATTESTATQVRTLAYTKLDELKVWLENQIKNEKDDAQRAHYVFAVAQIQQFQADPKKFQLTSPLSLPPGAPIGSLTHWDCGFQIY